MFIKHYQQKSCFVLAYASVALLVAGCAPALNASHGTGETATAAAATTAGSTTTTAVTSPSAGASATTLNPELWASAQKAFQNNCASCHGPNSPAFGNINYILDADQLVSNQLVIPGKPMDSPLWQQIDSGRMPQGRTISDSDKSAIQNWILNGFTAPSPTPSPSPTASATPTPSASPTPVPMPTPSPTVLPSPTPSPPPIVAPTAQPTPDPATPVTSSDPTVQVLQQLLGFISNLIHSLGL